VKVPQAPAVAVLAVVGAGLLEAARGHWRVGTATIALALALAALLRVVLAPRRAGWLVVRSRAFDALLLLGAAAAVFALAVTIPHPA
jgi:hypothetical protein